MWLKAFHSVPSKALRGCLLSCAALALVVCSCREKGPSSPSEYINSIRFGAAINAAGTDLTGEGETFRLESDGSTSIFFRLESQRDISTGGVVLEFSKIEEDGSITPYRTVPFDPPQASTNVLLSGFILTDAATYIVAAHPLSEPAITIAQQRLVLLPNDHSSV